MPDERAWSGGRGGLRAALAVVAALAGGVPAQDLAALRLEPPSALLDRFDPVRVKVRVLLDGGELPVLPDEIGTHVERGRALVQSVWMHDPEVDAWRWEFLVTPRSSGFVHVRFFHQELEAAGASDVLRLQVIASDETAPVTLLRVTRSRVEPLSPDTPLHLLPGETVRIRARAEQGGVENLEMRLSDTRDLVLEAVGPGEVLARASPSPVAPGVRVHLVAGGGATGRTPTAVPLVILPPCPICGAAHAASYHGEVSLLEEETDAAQARPEPDVLAVADCLEFEMLNLERPARTYLETTDPLAIFSGVATERLEQADARVEHADGLERVRPGIVKGSGRRAPFLARVHLRLGLNRIQFQILDRAGAQRTVSFLVVRR